MSVTKQRDTSTEQRDTSGFCVTDERDTLARAHPPTEGLSQCHSHAPRDTVTVTRDSDNSPRGGTVTVTGPSSEERREKEKARFAADPRFAAWTAGQPAKPLDLGTFDDPVDPVAARVLAERRELFRITGQSALDRSRGGRDLDLDARAWAQQCASITPLVGPLGTGEPS